MKKALTSPTLIMPAAHTSTALPDHVLAAASAALACPRPLAGVRGDLRWAPGRAETAEGSAEPLPQLFAGWDGLWPAYGEAPNPGPTALRASAVLHPTTHHARVARRIESRVHGWRHWRPLSRTPTRVCGPACAHALPRRTGPACSVTFSKFTCIPERPGGRSGPGRSEPGRRAGSGPSGPGRERGHGESHRGRPEGTGTERATRLALPGLRMQRWLGTDASRARCMLMAGGRAMNYSAAARRGRARLGGRPGPRVPRRCRAAAPTSQTFPGPHRGCGPRGAAVPARARWPRFPRCRLFYVFCLGVGTCPRERVSLPTPSPPDRGGGGGTGDRGGGDEGSEAPARPASWGDRPGAVAAAVPEHPGTPALRGGQGCERARNTNEAAVPAAGPCVRAPPLPGGPHPDGRAWAGRAAGAADSPPRPRAWPRSSACAPPQARRPGRSPLARARPAAPPVAFARPPHWAPHRGDPPVEPRGQRSGEG